MCHIRITYIVLTHIVFDTNLITWKTNSCVWFTLWNMCTTYLPLDLMFPSFRIQANIKNVRCFHSSCCATVRSLPSFPMLNGIVRMCGININSQTFITYAYYNIVTNAGNANADNKNLKSEEFIPWRMVCTSTPSTFHNPQCKIENIEELICCILIWNQLNWMSFVFECFRPFISLFVTLQNIFCLKWFA